MQETNLMEQKHLAEAIASQTPTPAPAMRLCSYGNKLTVKNWPG